MKHADFLDDAADLTQRASRKSACFKGDPVYVEGKLKTRSWEKDGQKQYSTEIVAENMQLLGGRRDDGGGGQQQQRQGGHQGGGQQQRGGGQRNEYAEQTGRGNRTQQQRHAPRDNGFESGGGRGPDGFEDDVPFMSAQHHRLDHAF
ncbi:single-stranded DNA-binding protein [Ralstonia phage RPZH3]|nr:single-stranded DNA-binding protein [Ralstonia phage RPZH3]